jgi:hypothetical protein
LPDERVPALWPGQIVSGEKLKAAGWQRSWQTSLIISKSLPDSRFQNGFTT